MAKKRALAYERVFMNFYMFVCDEFDWSFEKYADERPMKVETSEKKQRKHMQIFSAIVSRSQCHGLILI